MTEHAKTDAHWRIIFALAAVYNISFGAWTVIHPQSFFEVFDLETPRYLWLWSCLGMVIGIYGLGYGYVAIKPARGDAIVVLGLLGKILGPTGWIMAVQDREIPAQTFPLILFNDLVWWFPFGMYLLRKIRFSRTIVALASAAFHLAASSTLWVVRFGTQLEPNPANRLNFVRENAGLWVTCWFLWVASSLSLLAVLVCWSAKLRECGSRDFVLITAVTICIIGLAFDLSSETIAITRLTDPALAIEEWSNWSVDFTLLGPGIANGLYAIAGSILSFISWRTRLQRGPLGSLAISMWIAAAALTIVALFQLDQFVPLFGGLVMILFIPWVALTGLITFRANCAPKHVNDSNHNIPPNTGSQMQLAPLRAR